MDVLSRRRFVSIRFGSIPFVGIPFVGRRLVVVPIFKVDYLRDFDFLEKCYCDVLLGPPKEFFDEIKKGSKNLWGCPFKLEEGSVRDFEQKLELKQDVELKANSETVEQRAEFELEPKLLVELKLDLELELELELEPEPKLVPQPAGLYC